MARPRSITRATPYTPTRGLVGGQTFTSQRQYENALARTKGFRSGRERRQAPKVVSTVDPAAGLRRSEQKARRRVLHAVSDMRRAPGMSRAEAARRNNTTTEAMMRYAAPAMRRDDSGRYRAKRSDRMPRRMNAITPEGVQPITLSGRGASRDASLIGRHQWAVGRALKGDEEPLDNLIRKHGDDLSRLGLETDVDVLAELWTLGLLDDLDDPYAVEGAA